MHQANECIRPHKKRKVNAAPERLRRGIFWDSRAGQYGTRIGNSIDEQTGRVGRSNVQRLGANPDAAIIEHAKLSAAWKDLKARWPEIMPTLRMKLPGDLGNKAQIEKPFWLLPQWEQDARIENTTGLLNTVDAVKDALKQEQAELLPADLQARLFAALQPPIHETMGFTVDAERLTIEQVRTRYLDDMKSRIGLPEDGIKPGTYRNADRMTRLALAVTVQGATDPFISGGELYFEERGRRYLVGSFWTSEVMRFETPDISFALAKADGSDAEYGLDGDELDGISIDVVPVAD